MASDSPSNPIGLALRTPEADVPNAASQSPGPDQHRESAPLSPTSEQRRYPVGWSLNDEEYESESESGSQDYGPSTPHDDTGSDHQDGGSLGQLKQWLESHCKDALFACGGAIPIIVDTPEVNAPKREPSADEELPSSSASDRASSLSSGTAPSAPPHPPVTLRWDPRDSMTPAAHCKLNFPIEESSADNLNRLLADMEPAAFGRGGEHVYDESYRKASKMDPSRFTTSFCPYTSGIVSVVSQLLLPNPLSEKQRTLKAELYKLNVYTGPSGHFSSHVDTPGSRSQIGSLVVCLPVQHKGGALEVRQEDQLMHFDWDNMDPEGPQIQWAAFYSDCEHEVREVTSGHRITLTYNLYVTRGDGQLSNHPNALTIDHTPLFGHLEELISDKEFLPDGGYLGFYTTHTYPHSFSQACLTDTLKGVDMNVWQAFQRLGCGVCLRPVLITDPFERRAKPRHIGTEFPLDKYNWTIDQEEDWKNLLNTVWGLEKLSIEDIVWLNKADESTAQAAFTYMTYGNEPSTDLAYSLCAIIVGVPKYADNGRMALKTTFDSSGADESSWDEHPPYPFDDGM
ncbi:Fe2OG dioxygenase domain-containing protein [Fusarium sp. LHS14.1]|nr:Fe2OG dioxygenase domain-containing protein [Fusarium sp. LHS14.1]